MLHELTLELLLGDAPEFMPERTRAIVVSALLLSESLCSRM